MPKMNFAKPDLMRRVRSKLVGKAIRSGFDIRKPIFFDAKKHQFIFFHSRKPVGHYFVRRTIREPKATVQMVRKARVRFEAARALVSKLEKLALNPEHPLQEIVALAAKQVIGAHQSSLDYIFDAMEYSNELAKLVTVPKRGKLGDIINATLMPPNGNIALTDFKKNMLLLLGHELGERQSVFGAHTFSKFNWEWYRRNYASLGGSMDELNISEAKQRAQLNAFVKKEGIKKYEDVVAKLGEINKEKATARRQRFRAREKLLRMANPGEREKVRALIDFAGEATAINEELHSVTGKMVSLLVLAAEKRKVSRRTLHKVLEELSKPSPK